MARWGIGPPFGRRAYAPSTVRTSRDPSRDPERSQRDSAASEPGARLGSLGVHLIGGSAQASGDDLLDVRVHRPQVDVMHRQGGPGHSLLTATPRVDETVIDVGADLLPVGRAIIEVPSRAHRRHEVSGQENAGY